MLSLVQPKNVFFGFILPFEVFKFISVFIAYVWAWVLCALHDFFTNSRDYGNWASPRCATFPLVYCFL